MDESFWENKQKEWRKEDTEKQTTSYTPLIHRWMDETDLWLEKLLKDHSDFWPLLTLSLLVLLHQSFIHPSLCSPFADCNHLPLQCCQEPWPFSTTAVRGHRGPLIISRASRWATSQALMPSAAAGVTLAISISTDMNKGGKERPKAWHERSHNEISGQTEAIFCLSWPSTVSDVFCQMRQYLRLAWASSTWSFVNLQSGAVPL